jgi:rare lipoprotein A
MVLAAGLVLATSLSAPICSAAPERKTSPSHHVQIGEASWYGVHQAGHRTASGEPYDPRDLTAAHPSLPLHSTVRVTNLKNGLWVDVRVNDRGPYSRHRVIDLSQKAAEMIGLKRRGVARVKIEPVTLQPVAYHPEG